MTVVRATLSMLVLALVAGPCHAAAAELLTNGGFEIGAGGRAQDWVPFEQGYSVALEPVRSGHAAIQCTNAAYDDRRGATATLRLNQKTAAPIVVSGWSRAREVGGFQNNDYAIYLDLEYMDGTPLWGQTAPFSVGTHDWERRRVLVVPSKPVKTVSIHALFRHHTGTVWFDDFAAVVLGGSDFFDSQPLTAPRLPLGRTAGWFLRDVSGHGQPVWVGGLKGSAVGRVEGLEVRTSAAGPNRTATIVDRTGRDRALTLYYVERIVGATKWWHDIRTWVDTGSAGERSNVTRVNAGATGSISLYPFACVSGPAVSRCVGVPPLLGPRVVRFGYHAGERLMYAAFDMALTPKVRSLNTADGHSSASAAVVSFSADPAWGFRSAADRYYAMYPDVFARRAKAEGLWIPFTDPGIVKGLADFGIAYHEGDNSMASDDRLGILSFRYTEPMTYWMPMPPSMPRTYEAALALVRQQATGVDAGARALSQAVLTSGAYDAQGRYCVEFQNAPWTNGAVWALNPNPRLVVPPGMATKASLSYTRELADRMYSRSAAGVQDGEYLDSIEGWADVMDYRPENLAASSVPATYSGEDPLPLLPTWFSVYELARYMRDDLRARGKLLMANATPWRIHAFSGLLDVMGTETNWRQGGRWTPDSDAVFNLRRTLCRQKPYLLLQNTDFDKFDVADVERYFQRSMFYGVFPSMFSVDASTRNYWTEPGWYERDRHLFVRYIPVIKRLSAAGWEAVTHARTGSPVVYVERYGSRYLTVMNSQEQPVDTMVRIDIARMTGLKPGRVVVQNEMTGQALATDVSGGVLRVPVHLKADETLVLRVVEAGRP